MVKTANLKAYSFILYCSVLITSKKLMLAWLRREKKVNFLFFILALTLPAGFRSVFGPMGPLPAPKARKDSRSATDSNRPAVQPDDSNRGEKLTRNRNCPESATPQALRNRDLGRDDHVWYFRCRGLKEPNKIG
jgi:hypothetical protein